jgi:hypothetical protein
MHLLCREIGRYYVRSSRRDSYTAFDHASFPGYQDDDDYYLSGWAKISDRKVSAAVYMVCGCALSINSAVDVLATRLYRAVRHLQRRKDDEVDRQITCIILGFRCLETQSTRGT